MKTYTYKSISHVGMKTELICKVKKRKCTLNNYCTQLGFFQIAGFNHYTKQMCRNLSHFEKSNQLPNFPRDNRMSDIIQTDGKVHTVGSTNRNTCSELN